MRIEIPDERFAREEGIFGRVIKRGGFGGIETFTTTMEEKGIGTTDKGVVLVIVNGSIGEGDLEKENNRDCERVEEESIWIIEFVFHC